MAQISRIAFFLGLMALLFAGAVQNSGWLALGPQTAPRAQTGAARPAPEDPTPPATVHVSHASFGVVELEPDRNAQYRTDIEIDGTSLHAMVDTGATFVTLTAEDASQLNIALPASAYVIPVQTANGTSKVAHVSLREIRVNDITIHDVDALVAPPGALNITLLGMSFLKKLDSFQVADGRFVMKQ
jgi:aspartyl protease family protein